MLVLPRHGESNWNEKNRFTGWTDVDLSKRGIAQARNGLEIDNFEPDIVKLNIPTGISFVYEFDAKFRPVKRYYVGAADDSGWKRLEGSTSL